LLFAATKYGRKSRAYEKSQEYRNPFRDVHKKAEALKRRAQEELKKDEELRKKKRIQALAVPSSAFLSATAPVVLNSRDHGSTL